MKRDIDLIRKLLIYLEDKPDDKIVKVEDVEIDTYDKNDIMYHFILMDQAGLIRCERQCSSSTPDRVINIYPFSLTWEGHEFLEASRDESTWNNAKSIILSKSGSLSLDVLKALLISMAKTSVGV